MAFKTLDEIRSYAGYKKEIKAQLNNLKGTAVKFVYIEKFDFNEKKDAPLLLLVPGLASGLLDEVKKGQATPALGRCRRVDTKDEDPRSTAGEVLHFEKVGSGTIKQTSLSKMLKEAGVSDMARIGEGAEEEGDLRAKPLGDKFVGEDQRKGWRTEDPAQKNSDAVTTKYDRTPQQRDASRVTPNAKGELRTATGDPIGFNTGNTKPGFVMDPKTKQVHVFEPGATTTLPGDKKQIAHHSTPLAGAPVAGAGHLVAPGGKVTEIHDDSGHYKPSADFTLQVVEQLEALGVALLDESVVDAQGRPPAKEHKQKYKELKERVQKVQAIYDAARQKLADKFDPAKPPPELVKARQAIVTETAALRALGFAPANKPATVKLQGKFAIPDNEFAPLKGKLDAINAWIETKTHRKNVLPATIDKRILDSLEALNLEIGKALAVSLTTQQFKQTGGNEAAIGVKAQAMDLIRKKGETAAHQPDASAQKAIDDTRQKTEQREKAALPKTAEERFNELGGVAALVKAGFPSDKTHYLNGVEEDAVKVLEKTMTMSDLRDQIGV